MISLFDYQKTGADWLAEKRWALLADEMGLGKSAQAIRASDSVFITSAHKKILVACPAIARANWKTEFEKFSNIAHIVAVVYHESEQIDPKASVVVCSYDLVSKVALPAHFSVLILDEAHYLKSPEATRTAAIFGKRGLVHRAEFVWALTGTPMPNGNASELWPLLYTFGRTPLSYDDFVKRYCTYYHHMDRMQVTGTKESMIPEFQKLLAPIILRRLKKDVMPQLPPITYGQITIEPGPVDLEAQSSFIQYVFPLDRTKEFKEKIKFERKLIENLMEHAEFERDAFKAMEVLQSSVSTLRRWVGLQKLQGIVDLVSQELTDGAYKKIVIFAVHRDVIEGLRAKLSKFGACTLYGGTDPHRVAYNIQRFQKEPRIRIMIANIQAAGTAITLTAAHHILFAELDWVPGNNAQAAMRCHRIGQSEPVSVRVTSLPDSLDQRISQILRLKTQALTKIFDEEGLQKAKSPGNNRSSRNEKDFGGVGDADIFS